MRDNNKMKHKKLLEGICFLGLATIVLLAFSTRTSPLYSLLYGDYTGNEVSHAMLIGKYWVQGKIPYKDLYLIGGPVYFAIQAAGWMIGGRIGILILQIINFTLYLFFTEKTVEFFATKKKAIIYVGFSVIPYIALCSGGNSSEEWSLSILAIILWLIFSECQSASLMNKKIALLGVLSGIVLFLQWQALGIAVVGYIYFTFLIVKKREWKKLAILAGSIIFPVVIIFGYFYRFDCIREMIECALIYPVKIQIYEGFSDIEIIAHKMIKCFFYVPCLIGGVQIYRKGRKEIGIIVSSLVLSSVGVLMFNDNNWVHYLTVIPIIPLTFAIFEKTNNKSNVVNLIFACSYIVLCCIPLKNYGSYILEGVQGGAAEFYVAFTTYLEEYPDNQWLMVDTDSSYLIMADETPNVKFYAMQSKLAEYDKDVENALKKYVDDSSETDVLISSEQRWGKWESEEYNLTQVYIKYRGNISIYVSNNLTEE